VRSAKRHHELDRLCEESSRESRAFLRSMTIIVLVYGICALLDAFVLAGVGR
jgi:hypothetical protein